MTLGALLDATYALVVAEAASSSVPQAQAVEALERTLAEPLPDEVAAEDLGRRRRAQVVEENEAAIARLTGIAGMQRGKALPS